MAIDNPGPIDELIDRALAGYGGEPRQGLERRILESIGKPARGNWWWLIPVPVVAALAGAVMVFWTRMSAPEPPRVKASVAVLAPDTGVRPGSAARIIRRTRLRQPRALEVFPTPQPLSEDERALLTIARQAPASGFELAAGKPAPPLTISPIEIQPLDTGQ